MTTHNTIQLRESDGSRPISARWFQHVMQIIQEWRARQINYEDYPDIYDLAYDDGFEIDSDGNWIALESEQHFRDVMDDPSETASFDYNEVIFDEQEPEPERDEHDSPCAEDYQ
jgi:hypothetical protein